MPTKVPWKSISGNTILRGLRRIYTASGLDSSMSWKRSSVYMRLERTIQRAFRKCPKFSMGTLFIVHQFALLMTINRLHQDIKPSNILVMDNGAGSPFRYIFKLADL